ncbi:hypothetical protein BD311DRAFT_764995 [Dichomitus squalens]|uniref:Uncharacterized protein n=1 Tax=Dichomitus squalens TaxID=114155 RepID=A0A4Q9MF26_9APHY|nr:hypothetical protein BD311DRAFT_764995 [Dichomitus squalens]
MCSCVMDIQCPRLCLVLIAHPYVSSRLRYALSTALGVVKEMTRFYGHYGESCMHICS